MQYLRGGLGAVLLFAVVVRISGEVIAPVIPSIIVLFVLAVIISIIINRTIRF
jgi:hypothetical protein